MLNTLKRCRGLLALLAITVVTMAQSAQAQITLHSDSMPDAGDYASAAGSTAGAGVGKVLLVAFAFIAVGVVVRWYRRLSKAA